MPNARHRSVFAATCAVAGAAVGAWQAAGWRPTGTELVAAGLCALLGVLWSFMLVEVHERSGGRLRMSLAAAAYLALAATDPAAAAIVAALVNLAEWAFRRRPSADLPLAIGASQVPLALAGALIHTAAIHATPLDAALATAAAGLVFAALHATMHLVALALVREGSPWRTRALGVSALLAALVAATSAPLLAALAVFSPLAMLVPAVPMTIAFVLVGRLEWRRDTLERSRHELQSLQELGLKVSAQLDVADLAPIVVRIVAGDLGAEGAALMLFEGHGGRLAVSGLFDPAGRAEPPETPIDRRALDDAFFARRDAVVIDAARLPSTPELAWLDAQVALVQPLHVLGRPGGVLVVFDRGTRGPFGVEDVARCGALTRYIEVALDNAHLVDDLKRFRERCLETEKLSALGQLVSGVAHELNNPLATVIGTAQLCLASEMPPRPALMVRRIERQAERAARIVRSLLTFARRHTPEMGWHDLGAAVREVLELREYSCRTRNIELSAEIEPGLPLLRLDLDQVHQVLLNLVTNAEQALDHAGRPGHVTIRVAHHGHRVRLEVEDDGPGIPVEALDRIFDPFFTTKPVGQGTGLGLSICYGIVREHGGTVRAMSSPGRGTIFAIDLPVPKPGLAPALPTGRATTALVPAGPYRSGTVLVVDDEPGVRAVLAEALSMWGMTVVEAASGEEGLRALAGRRFDLAVIDLRMPGMDGEAMYRAARRERLNLPPVIFSTGDAANPQARQFLDRAGCAVLLKPFSLLTLKETIDAALDGASTHR